MPKIRSKVSPVVQSSSPVQWSSPANRYTRSKLHGPQYYIHASTLGRDSNCVTVAITNTAQLQLCVLKQSSRIGYVYTKGLR